MNEIREYTHPQLSPFTDEIRLRVIDIDNEPWFIAMDVAETLGYSDPYEMNKRLDADEKRNLQIDGFGNRGVILINESGLYNAIMGSNKDEAKPFRKWVTSEVLPSIRKTGGYSLAPKSFAEALRLAADQQEEIERQQAQLTFQEPLVELATELLVDDGYTGLRETAKELGMKEKTFLEWMKEMKWIYKQQQFDSTLTRGGQTERWQPYAAPKNKGWLVFVPRLCKDGRHREQTLVTREGLAMLHKLRNKM